MREGKMRQVLRVQKKATDETALSSQFAAIVASPGSPLRAHQAISRVEIGSGKNLPKNLSRNVSRIDVHSSISAPSRIDLKSSIDAQPSIDVQSRVDEE